MSLRQTEAERRMATQIALGTVTAVDTATNTVRVAVAGLETAALRVLQIRSGAIRLHWMPSVGEQVTVFAPGGDLTQAVVGGSLPVAGGAIAPDAESPTMDLGGGRLRVIGDLHVDGEIVCTGDVIAGDISLIDHVHAGVMSGPDVSGVPQ